MTKIEMRTENKAKRIPWLIVILSLIISMVAVRVEILNYQAGNILSIKYPEDYQGKWRYGIEDPEKLKGIYSKSFRFEFGLPDDSLIPQDKQKEIDDRAIVMAEKAKYNNHLKDTIVYFGILLYPICPIVFLRSLYLIVVEYRYINIRITAICCLIIASVTSFHLLYRDYIGSLHW